MKLIKLSVVFFIITSFMACNTDRPYKIVDIHEGTPTNADSVLYNLDHGEAVHGVAPHGEAPSTQEHSEKNKENLPRVFWR